MAEQAKHTPGAIRWSQNSDRLRWEDGGHCLAKCASPEIAEALCRIWNAAHKANPENPVAAVEALPDLLAACVFLLKACQQEGMDVIDGPYDAQYVAAATAIAKAKEGA